jgi:hypothetical protein
MLAVAEAEHLDVIDPNGATGRRDVAHRAFEHALMRARERALLNDNVIDEVNTMYIDARIGECRLPFPVRTIPPGAANTTSSASTSAKP